MSEEKYLRILRSRVGLCCKTLDVVRHIIQRNVEKGLLPNYTDGGIDMSKQYSTVGIIGLYEVIEYFGFTTTDEFGNVSYTDDGIEFASKIFDVINKVKDSFVADYSFNIESVPGERCAVVLCQKDNMLYDSNDKFIYSNQWIPLSTKCTIQEKLRLSAVLDAKCSGGAIAHINIESNFPNTDVAWDVLNMIAQSGVIYFAFNTKINECEDHHGFVGTDTCPTCGKPVYDTYQRIVGYLVPTRSYSKDRFREFKTRNWYQYAEMLHE
jgi:ribonucleoside-triphosphate reductase